MPSNDNEITFKVVLTGGKHITGAPKFRISYEGNGSSYSTVGHSLSGALRSATAHGVSETEMTKALNAIGVK